MAAPTDPILINAFVRDVKERGMKWFREVKKQCVDDFAAGSVITALSAADSTQSAVIDMAPSDRRIFFELVEQEIEGVRSGSNVNHMQFSGRYVSL